MQKTTLEQWRMFKAVVDHGGFNQAAEVIHKSQSTIHHAVRKLEEVLGTQLLEVQGRKATLTDHGELLLRRGKFLLAEVERIESVADALSSGVEATLNIAIDEAYPQCTIYDVLQTVSAKFPTLKIEIHETILSGANDLINKGIVDLGLSPSPMEHGLNEEICQIEFIAVASPAHPLHQLKRALTYEDLKSYRQIVVRDSALNDKTDDGWLGAEQQWTVSHMRTSIDLVTNGLGIAWLPLLSIGELIESKQLQPLNLKKGQKRSVAFYLNYKDQDKLGPASREFMGELRYATLTMPTSD
jgi:DNA-binding transcriptional LysR family regulator